MQVKRISVTIDVEKQGGTVSKMVVRPDRIVGLVELTNGCVLLSVESVNGAITSWFVEDDYETLFTQIESYNII